MEEHKNSTPNTPSEAQESVPVEVNPELSKLSEENARLNDQLLRLAAEMENTRKRLAKDLEEANRYGITKFARELIEVLENLHRAESSIKTSEELEKNDALKSLFAGVELTKKSLVDVFEKFGIKRLDPVIGDKFDHNFHQAIAQMPAVTHDPDSIIQVIQAGYVIHDRLLRPALVAVAK